LHFFFPYGFFSMFFSFCFCFKRRRHHQLLSFFCFYLKWKRWQCNHIIASFFFLFFVPNKAMTTSLMSSPSFFYATRSSLMDSTTNLKVTTTEGKWVGVRSLARNISGVEGRVGASGWGPRRLTSKSITHTNLHKPNNKLVIA
jgi:hypothetical protein